MADRLKIVLVCEQCSARNYQTTKARDVKDERFALKKHCPQCKRHTLHRESR